MKRNENIQICERSPEIYEGQPETMEEYLSCTNMTILWYDSHDDGNDGRKWYQWTD